MLVPNQFFNDYFMRASFMDSVAKFRCPKRYKIITAVVLYRIFASRLRAFCNPTRSILRYPAPTWFNQSITMPLLISVYDCDKIALFSSKNAFFIKDPKSFQTFQKYEGLRYRSLLPPPAPLR